MKKYFLCCFIFLISCSTTQNEVTITVDDSSFETVTTTVPELTFENDHDDEGHDEHKEERHHDEEAEVFVPNDIPNALEVLNYKLSEKIEIHFISDVEKEIHIHGYDIHFMVYPDKQNVLELELKIAGEFEIEDHDGGFEFARLIVSP
ncbi:hypothetical protein N9W48_00150 [Candidatus Actinomarina sp.]|nr:hypothetical protein [Candidatus Actinomarina sp.]